MSDKLTVNPEGVLRILAALAINQLTGSVAADRRVEGKQLRDFAIKWKLFEFDGAHHAPRCPANHYHQQRLPTGACNCGAAVE
jgi:hypothetical protein